MKKSILLNRKFVNFGIPLGLFGILILLMKSSFLNRSEILNLAITIDLLLIVPIIYFLLISKSDIPKTTVIPFMVIGLLIGSYFLPKESRNYIDLFKIWVLPFFELFILTFIIYKVRKAIKSYRKLKSATPDFYNTLKNVCYEILPKKLVMPFVTEVAVFYYGFINWNNRPLQENEFTYHNKSGTPALLGAFILIIGIETVAFHFLLTRWSEVIAWVLSALSIYTAVQVFGFAKSLSKRPISISQNTLMLKYGILNEVDIPLSNIEAIEISRKSLDKNILTKTLSPLGAIESHNTIIHLKKENELIGIYGLKKRFKVIGLHIDKPKEFKEKIEAILQQDA